MEPAALAYPPTIIFGTQIPDIRLRWRNRTQSYFCRRNYNLNLTGSDFVDGTYSMGALLHRFCRDHCLPKRAEHQPCPAFIGSHKIGTENKGLASVDPNVLPMWEACAGVKAFLDATQTDDERYFLELYLDDKYADEDDARTRLIEQWNARWHHVPEGWQDQSRRSLFDRMLWGTLRFPALIPQVWLNWLNAASEEEQRALDENPSRVDFVAFWRGYRVVIEIDGPSHYADYDGISYRIDERAYARNLKIERSLRREEWHVIRIGRSEVREVKDADSGFFGGQALLSILPFHRKESYSQPLRADLLGVPAIIPPRVPVPVPAADDDDIPF